MHTGSSASRFIDAAVLFLTLGPGGMAFFSGLIGSVMYWTHRTTAPAPHRLSQGLNVGAVVGFMIGFPSALLFTGARLANLI